MPNLRVFVILGLAACAADNGPTRAIVMPKPAAMIDVPGALVLVIDRSGSMQGGKLDAVKNAVMAAVDAIDPRDDVAVVAFDSAATVVVPMQPASHHDEISRAVATIAAGGGTDILPGLTSAYDLLRRSAATTKHIVVLTDGEFPTDGLFELIRRGRTERVTLTAIGVEGADKGQLDQLGNEGGGRTYQIDDLAALSATFVRESRLALR